MEHGDLSNKVSPRILLVFENAMGFCTDRAKFDKAVKRKHWDAASGLWDFNELMMRQILWLFWKKDVRTEVVTFLPGEFADLLLLRFDEIDLPIHRVWSTTPESLGRQIAYMPDLACVYDPEPSRWLMYGSKGRFLQHAAQLGEDVGHGYR
jgi:hypothetical protein